MGIYRLRAGECTPRTFVTFFTLSSSLHEFRAKNLTFSFSLSLSAPLFLSTCKRSGLLPPKSIDGLLYANYLFVYTFLRTLFVTSRYISLRYFLKICITKYFDYSVYLVVSVYTRWSHGFVSHGVSILNLRHENTRFCIRFQPCVKIVSLIFNIHIYTLCVYCRYRRISPIWADSFGPVYSTIILLHLCIKTLCVGFFINHRITFGIVSLTLSLLLLFHVYPPFIFCTRYLFEIYPSFWNLIHLILDHSKIKLLFIVSSQIFASFSFPYTTLFLVWIYILSNKSIQQQ